MRKEKDQFIECECNVITAGDLKKNERLRRRINGKQESHCGRNRIRCEILIQCCTQIEESVELRREFVR
jgi:hypothetical protein